MKKRIKYLVILFVVTLAALRVVMLINGAKILSLDLGYSVVGSNGKAVPCGYYSKRVRTVDNSNNRDTTINDFVLIFDDSLKVDSLDILVVAPAFPTIGRPEGGKRKFRRLGKWYLYQASEDADNFNLIVDNRIYFDDPPIKYARFGKDEIVFNSYSTLRQFGDSIIIKRINR